MSIKDRILSRKRNLFKVLPETAGILNGIFSLEDFFTGNISIDIEKGTDSFSLFGINGSHPFSISGLCDPVKKGSRYPSPKRWATFSLQVSQNGLLKPFTSVKGYVDGECLTFTHNGKDTDLYYLNSQTENSHGISRSTIFPSYKKEKKDHCTPQEIAREVSFLSSPRVVGVTTILGTSTGPSISTMSFSSTIKESIEVFESVRSQAPLQSIRPYSASSSFWTSEEMFNLDHWKDRVKLFNLPSSPEEYVLFYSRMKEAGQIRSRLPQVGNGSIERLVTSAPSDEAWQAVRARSGSTLLTNSNGVQYRQSWNLQFDQMMEKGALLWEYHSVSPPPTGSFGSSQMSYVVPQVFPEFSSSPWIEGIKGAMLNHRVEGTLGVADWNSMRFELNSTEIGSRIFYRVVESVQSHLGWTQVFSVDYNEGNPTLNLELPNLMDMLLPHLPFSNFFSQVIERNFSFNFSQVNVSIVVSAEAESVNFNIPEFSSLDSVKELFMSVFESLDFSSFEESLKSSLSSVSISLEVVIPEYVLKV